MKKLIFLFLVVFLFASANSFSQNFQFYRISPPVVQGDTSSLYPVVSKGVVINNASTAQNFKLVRIVNNIPSGWSTQLCIGILCFGSEVDTLPPYPINYTLQPNQKDTLYVDFLGATTGTGTVVMKCYVANNPAQYITDTFKVQLNYPSSIKQITEIAEGFELKQNYPNPFNPETVINFSIPKSETVNLDIYDILGNKVTSLISNTTLKSGTYSFNLNLNEYNLSSGTYFYILTAGLMRDTKKMVVIK